MGQKGFAFLRWQVEWKWDLWTRTWTWTCELRPMDLDLTISEWEPESEELDLEDYDLNLIATTGLDYLCSLVQIGIQQPIKMQLSKLHKRYWTSKSSDFNVSVSDVFMKCICLVWWYESLGLVIQRTSRLVVWESRSRHSTYVSFASLQRTNSHHFLNN